MSRLVIALTAVFFLLILPVAPTAEAAINFVADLGGNEVTGLGVGDSLTITTTAAAPAGASIIILSTAKGDVTPTSSTCSDSAAHVYTTDATQTTNFFTAICATHRIAAVFPAGSTLTVTSPGGGAPFSARARAFAVTGLASTPLDRTAAATGISTTPSS